jgi:hypothetical protein
MISSRDPLSGLGALNFTKFFRTASVSFPTAAPIGSPTLKPTTSQPSASPTLFPTASPNAPLNTISMSVTQVIKH